jgi:hypothetical protein
MHNDQDVAFMARRRVPRSGSAGGRVRELNRSAVFSARVPARSFLIGFPLAALDSAAATLRVALTLVEREEISRGVIRGDSLQVIAESWGACSQGKEKTAVSALGNRQASCSTRSIDFPA